MAHRRARSIARHSLLFTAVCALNYLHNGRRVVADAVALPRQPSRSQDHTFTNPRLLLSVWGRLASPGELDLREGREVNSLCLLSGILKDPSALATTPREALSGAFRPLDPSRLHLSQTTPHWAMEICLDSPSAAACFGPQPYQEKRRSGRHVASPRFQDAEASADPLL